MSIRRNILASYVGTGFTAIAPILALPVYLTALGPKQWGLVSFVALLQAVMGLLDAGMAQALTREFALRINTGSETTNRAAMLLYGFERIYWGFGLLMGLVVVLLANVISAHWIRLDDLPHSAGTLAIYGAAVLFAVQFPGSVYRSVLAGGQKQVTLNTVTTLSVLLRHGGGAIVVSMWPSLLTYLAWNAAVAFLETLARALLAWRSLGDLRDILHWRGDEVRQVLPFAAAMAGAVMLGALATQTDKIVLSKLVSVEQFGYYAIASSVALGVLQLTTPIVQIIVPRLVELGKRPDLAMRFNRKIFFTIATLVMVAGLGYGLLGKQLLSIWLRNPAVEAIVFPILSFLLIGSGLNALSEVGYANWVANGNTRLIVIRNLLALVFPVVMLAAFVKLYGLKGATFSWIINNALGFFLSSGWICWQRLAK